ncbi:hypothetical protein [Terrisporobacter sp.]
MLLLSDKETILDKILKSYQVYYDVEKHQNLSLPLVAKCEFHVHNEKYVLSQKAQLWSSDANEYVYIFKIDNLNEEVFLKCKDFAYENGMKLINPKSGHMYSYITTIFICDTCEDSAKKLMKKTKISKNFKFSLHGWMDFHISCIDISKNQIYSNSSGKVTSRFLKELFSNKTSPLKKLSKEYI